MDPLTERERSLLQSDGIYARTNIPIFLTSSVFWGTILHIDGVSQ
jgi:hypothetical protein